jgi:hypothetical protein
MRTVLRVLFVGTLAWIGFSLGPAACSSKSYSGTGGEDGGEDGGAPCVPPTCMCYSCPAAGSDGSIVLGSSGGGSSGSGPTPGTQGPCPGGGTTTISGTVYDPAMQNPVFNVAVYVPGTLPLITLPTQVSCASCSGLYSDPIASGVTDATGRFTVTNAPYGKNIPLVVQVGKWRMMYTIANVNQCQDNPQPDKTFHLPRSSQDGDLPQIAISTGAADSLECLLSRMGVAASEYTGGNGGKGHIHIFDGYMGAVAQGGSTPDPGMSLWDSDMDIDNYDVVLLSCEGEETVHMNQQVLWDYANKGGRVFASHFHYAWFNSGPFSTMITNPSLATWNSGIQLKGNVSSKVVTTLPGGGNFPEGTALNTWLQTVNALGPATQGIVGFNVPNGELPVIYSCDNATVTSSNTNSQQWVAADSNAPVPGSTQYFSFDLPLGTSAEAKCGRVVYSDLHVSGGTGGTARGSLPPDYASSLMICPDQCAGGALSPQEKALEFMIFDLSACLIPPGSMQTAPPVQ